MWRRGLALFVIVCIFVAFSLTILGCGEKKYEVRTYHKVYKDSDGNWRGKDVSYLTDNDYTAVIAAAAVGFVIFCIIKIIKKKK